MVHAKDDPFDLRRFVTAQEDAYERALSELRAGAKRSHWMWFIFPQIAGLGSSPMAQLYAIGSLDEARAYLAHPLLGPRLRSCTEVTLQVGGTAHALFGSPDDMKFRSSMTLFGRAAPEEPLFLEALARFYGGAEDPKTVERLR